MLLIAFLIAFALLVIVLASRMITRIEQHEEMKRRKRERLDEVIHHHANPNDEHRAEFRRAA